MTPKWLLPAFQKTRNATLREASTLPLPLLQV